MMRVLSDVYPPHIKPARDGRYLAGASRIDTTMRNFCDGTWRFENGDVCLMQGLYWRGLAFCPYSAIATTHTDVSIASQRVYEIEGVFVPGATCE